MIDPDLLTNAVLEDRWRLERLVGRGSTSWVFAARDLDGEQVAIKLLRPESPEQLSQAMDELSLLSALRGPNLVTYRAAGRITSGPLTGCLYIVTELCDGTLFSQPGFGIPGQFVDTVGPAMAQIAAALHDLHSHQVVHRDIKPTNILVHGDDYKVADFGLARTLLHTVGASSGLVGTVPYMAPELLGPPVGPALAPAADIWALGVVAHVALTGEYPFAAQDDHQVLGHLASARPVTVSPTIPRPWAGFVRQCCAIDPRRRPAATEVGGLAVGAAREGRGICLAHKGAEARGSEAPLRPARRSMWRISTRSALAVLLLTVLTVLISGFDRGASDLVSPVVLAIELPGTDVSYNVDPPASASDYEESLLRDGYSWFRITGLCSSDIEDALLTKPELSVLRLEPSQAPCAQAGVIGLRQLVGGGCADGQAGFRMSLRLAGGRALRLRAGVKNCDRPENLDVILSSLHLATPEELALISEAEEVAADPPG